MDPDARRESSYNRRLLQTPPLCRGTSQQRPQHQRETSRIERRSRSRRSQNQNSLERLSRETWIRCVESPGLPMSGLCLGRKDITVQKTTRSRSPLHRTVDPNARSASRRSTALLPRQPICSTSRRDRSQRSRRNASRPHHRPPHQQNSPSRDHNGSKHKYEQPEHQTADHVDTPRTGDSNNAFKQFKNFLNNFPKPANPKLNYDINMIPKFDPSIKHHKIECWISKVNECALIYGWSDQQTSHFALTSLIGNAKKWYEGMQSINRSWSDWQHRLKRAFPSERNYGELLSEMLERRHKPRESLDDYYYEKMILLNACKIADKRAVDCIIHGLDDIMIKTSASSARFTQPEELLGFLKNICR